MVHEHWARDLNNSKTQPIHFMHIYVCSANQGTSLFSVSDHWLFSEDCSVQRFCSSPDGVMVCGNADGREVYAVTHDIVPGKGWVMQFKVNKTSLKQ